MQGERVGGSNDTLINGQLTISSHNYSFQAIKFSTMNVKCRLTELSKEMKMTFLCMNVVFLFPSLFPRVDEVCMLGIP